MVDPRQAADRGDTPRWASFVLATGHVALLVLLLLVPAYRGGGLGEALESLNTLIGLALFAALWLATWLATDAAVAPLSFRPLSPVLTVYGRAARCGGVAGALIAIVPFAPFVLTPAVVVLPVVLAVAFLVGAAVGLLLATVDLLLLGLAVWLERVATVRDGPLDPRVPRSGRGARRV